MNPRAIPFVGMALVSSACGESDAPARASPPVARVDAGDPNATFETAVPIDVGSQGVFDAVDGREDLDFFSFEGKAGEWIEIRAGSLDPLIVADARLTLYGVNREQLAYNRYVKSLRGENVLSRIVTRLPSDGKYFVEVGDPEAPPISAGFSQTYRLRIAELTAEPDGYTVEDPSSADPTPVRFHVWNIDPVVIDDSFVAGSFSDGSDVDSFSFTVAPGDPETLSAEVEESGDQANGSTSTAGRVWVTSATDSTVIGRIDNSQGQTTLTPPLDSGDYVLWVAHPDTPLGKNDFYVVRTMLGPENPIEAKETTNGAVASAEPLTTMTTNGQDTAFILAHVLDGDLDYFRFDGHAGETASAYCESRTGGSGTVGLHVSVRDAADTSLADATEVASSTSMPGSTVALENVPVPSSGTLYIRVSKDSQLPDVIGDWARCAVYAQ